MMLGQLGEIPEVHDSWSLILLGLFTLHPTSPHHSWSGRRSRFPPPYPSDAGESNNLRSPPLCARFSPTDEMKQCAKEGAGAVEPRGLLGKNSPPDPTTRYGCDRVVGLLHVLLAWPCQSPGRASSRPIAALGQSLSSRLRSPTTHSPSSSRSATPCPRAMSNTYRPGFGTRMRAADSLVQVERGERNPDCVGS